MVPHDRHIDPQDYNAHFPVLYCDEADSSYLYVFESLLDAERDLEMLEIGDQEHRAWDSRGYRLTLSVDDARAATGWLRISAVGDEPEVDATFLFGLVEEYGASNGVPVPREPTDSLHAFYQRVTDAHRHAAWSNRPLWRRVLGLPNAPPKHGGQ